MHTRRAFLQTAARAAVPAAVTAGAAPLLAQGPARRNGRQAALLGQITAELARLHRAARATPPRGEHARQAASLLRLLASLDLDADVRDGIGRLTATRGRPWLLTMPINSGEVTAGLHRFGIDAEARDLGLDQQPWAEREAALDALRTGAETFSGTLRSLASLLDRAGERIAARRDAAGIVAVQWDESCDDWRYYLSLLQFGLVVLCALGNAPGCIAVAASITIINWTMWEAGC